MVVPDQIYTGNCKVILVIALSAVRVISRVPVIYIDYETGSGNDQFGFDMMER